MYTSPSIVIGFHGCDQSTADQIIKEGASLSSSDNDYDWLGNGIYFWEGSYLRALEWATEQPPITKPAVIGAFIKLGHCLDLLDAKYIKKVSKTHTLLLSETHPLPQNTVHKNDISFVRALDCKVINRLQQLHNNDIAQTLGQPDKIKIQNHPDFYDSVRGMFPEGEMLYQNAGFRDKNHIQLCITNPNAIMGYFDPRKQSNAFKRLI
ncbi:MAG: hypothetical protein ACI8WB_002524 [Phenylobacterium sp.]|jgi:hypothetical protein